MQQPSYWNCITEEVTEIPRCFSISIQSDTAARRFFLALDRTGLGNGPAVEQEFFGERGLTGVGVRDNGKGTPPPDFVLQSRQGYSSSQNQIVSKHMADYIGGSLQIQNVITELVYHSPDMFSTTIFANFPDFAPRPHGAPSTRSVGRGAHTPPNQAAAATELAIIAPLPRRHVGMPPYGVQRGCGANRGPVRADIKSAPTTRHRPGP